MPNFDKRKWHDFKLTLYYAHIVTYILCRYWQEGEIATTDKFKGCNGVYLSLFVWSLMVNYTIKSLFN